MTMSGTSPMTAGQISVVSEMALEMPNRKGSFASLENEVRPAFDRSSRYLSEKDRPWQAFWHAVSMTIRRGSSAIVHTSQGSEDQVSSGRGTRASGPDETRPESSEMSREATET